MKISTTASHQRLTTPDPIAREAEATPPAIRRAGGGLRFLGALLMVSTLSLLSCQSLFVL